jgi:hypothetical protein
MSEPSGDLWFHCSACRKDIGFGAIHWVCSVSTCNRARMQLVFCSVPCWDSHVATLRHREAWAVEARAPSRDGWAAARGEAGSASPQARTEAPTSPLRGVSPSTSSFSSVSSSSPSSPSPAPAPTLLTTYDRDDVLIVVSKLKKYIKDRSGMNTSDAVADVLGEHVRSICDEAIRAAARDGRKTVLDRDVPHPRRPP